MTHVTSLQNLARTAVVVLIMAVWLSPLGLAPTVLAQSPSATPRASATPKASAAPLTATTPAASGSTTQNLKDRIEKVVEEKRDQIKGVLDELTGQKKGFIGEVQRVSAETMTIKTRKGTQILSLGNNAKLTQKGATVGIDDLVVGNWVIVIGQDQEDTFQPERVILSSISLRPKPQVVSLGTVKTLSKTELVINNRKDGQEQHFTLTKTSQFQDSEGNPIKTTVIDEDMQAWVVGQTTDKGTELFIVRILAPLES